MTDHSDFEQVADMLPPHVVDAVASAVAPVELGAPGSASSELVHRVACVTYDAVASLPCAGLVKVQQMLDRLRPHLPNELFAELCAAVYLSDQPLTDADIRHGQRVAAELDAS